MASISTTVIDEGIRVVVTPSQASYFAGEPFSVTITFTNTRTPEAPVAPRSASHAHRRGAHSISSVPLARPPTSPGTPRTVVPVFTSRANGESSSTRRKGLIGHGVRTKLTDEPPSVEVLRKRLLASRSLSISLAPHELPQDAISEAVSPASAGPSPVITCKHSSAATKLCWPRLMSARRHGSVDELTQIPLFSTSRRARVLSDYCASAEVTFLASKSSSRTEELCLGRTAAITGF